MMRKRTTSHSSPSKNEKQKFSNLIKVLRPKVYITDTSKFKTLVQELTGNGNGKGTCVISSPPENTPETIEKAPFINVEHQEYDHHESSMETSVEGYVDSFDLCNAFQTEHDPHQEVSQVHSYNQQAYMDDINAGFDDQMSLPMDQREDLLPYQDLESWLLSSDDQELCSSSYNGYYAQTQQHVNMYDYASYLG